MVKEKTQSLTRTPAQLGLLVLVLAVVLSFLFLRAFLPGHVVFSNDGPLGAQVAEEHRVPEIFSGGWEDLNSVGYRGAGAMPNLTFGFFYVLGPIGFSRFFPAIALFILGLGAWTFFRQLGFSNLACITGSLAAVLNSTFLGVAAWGVASQAITLGMIFFAMAAVADMASPKRWLRLVLGGLAVGMAVVEGADVGAIFSLYLAGYMVYQAWVSEGPRAKNVAVGLARVGVVAVFAAFLAAQTISVLVGTQIKGVAGAKQDEQSKQERWDWATQWSLPKREALGLVVPGLFGYRMDTPIGLPKSMQESYKGGHYWGAVGRDPNWYYWWAGGKQGPQPGGGLRFSGGGFYAGILVALVAAWAAVQAFRKKDSVFPLASRKLLWFWVAVVVVSLLLAFGRFAPFYQILYALPYFSTIRNPGKFLFPLSWAIMILFAYGMDGLWRRYMAVTPGGTAVLGVFATVQAWWQKARGFDKRWAGWSLAALAASALGWLIYASSRQGLEKYLQEVGFGEPEMAADIAGFSITQVGWFVLFFAIAIALMTLVLSGAFSGWRAKWGAALLGLFLVADLGLANRPWIIAWDYNLKYATNPVIEMLRKEPYQHRVATLPRWFTQVFNLPQQLLGQQGYVAQLYNIEWAQHHFLYYNIQSLDLIQMPRMPEDLLAFEMTFQPHSSADINHIVARKWELTNTRYLIGAADFIEVLNRAIDPAKQRFRIAERFSILPKPEIAEPTELQHLTAVIATNGPYAVFEFTGALPRAKLYSRWDLATNDLAMLSQLQAQVQTNGLSKAEDGFLKNAGTNDFLTLKKMASPAFDPHQTVLLAAPLPDATASTNTAASPGKVEFTSYAPKNIVLKTEAAAPSVLLLNDRYDPNWKVLVDGKPETLLRCNYLMRGVYLPAGTHTVQFRFEPPMDSFYVSLAAVGLGILLCGVLVVWRSKPVEPPPSDEKRKPEPAEKRMQPK